MTALLRAARRAARRTRDDESGLTLVELLVTVLLLSVVITVVGSIFMTSLNVQQRVSGTTSSTTSAQSSAATIDATVRNASAYALSASGTDQLLVARVAGSGSTLTWSCVAYYYSSSAGTIRTTRGVVGTKITAPSASTLATWTLLSTAVTPRTGSTIFTDVDGTSLNVAYDVTGAGKKVAIQFTTSRPIGVAVSTLAEADKCY